MQMLIQRVIVVDAALHGDLSINGEKFCVILENAKRQIPAGHYSVDLTPSARAQNGHLWTPWPDFLLPLVQHVPERVGIRIHAANWPAQLEGCFAVGSARLDEGVVESRMTLTRLMERVGPRTTWELDVRDPS